MNRLKLLWGRTKLSKRFYLCSFFDIRAYDRCSGDKVRNILVSLPRIPEVRLAGAYPLRLCREKFYGFPDAWPSSPGLVAAFVQIVVQVEDVSDPPPTSLNLAKPGRNALRAVGPPSQDAH